MFKTMGAAFKAAWRGDVEKVAGMIVKAETFSEARMVALGASLGNAAFYGVSALVLAVAVVALGTPAYLLIKALTS